MNPGAILQVEDDDNDVFLVGYAFRQAQVEAPLFVVSDGLSAIEYLGGAGEYADRGRFPLPRLVLLDLKLPRRSGLEVLEWIRRSSGLRELPVVVLTSSSRPEDVRAAYALGANAYLVKPPDAQGLLAMVKAFAAFWLGFNQYPV